MPGSLPREAVAQYQRDGFWFPWRIMPRDEAMAIGRRVMEFTTSPTARRYDDPVNQIYLLKAHLLFKWADEIAHSPALLDAVESFIGPDIMIWSSGVFWKAPRTGKFVSWHQDATTYNLDDVSRVVRAWVALSPATLENGTMRFLPRTHQQPISHKDTVQPDGLLSRGETLDLEIDESRTVPVLIDAGEVSFHHLYTPHASGPNGADIPRVNYVITFIDPRVRQLSGKEDSALLARGRDRWGHFAPEARPAADFDPAAMRVHKAAMIRRNAITFRGLTPPAPPPHPI